MSRASNALRRKSLATLAGSDGVRPFDLRTAVMTMLVSHARSVEDFVLLVGSPGCAGKSYFASELPFRLDIHVFGSEISATHCVQNSGANVC